MANSKEVSLLVGSGQTRDVVLYVSGDTFIAPVFTAEHNRLQLSNFKCKDQSFYFEYCLDPGQVLEKTGLKVGTDFEKRIWLTIDRLDSDQGFLWEVSYKGFQIPGLLQNNKRYMCFRAALEETLSFIEGYFLGSQKKIVLHAWADYQVVDVVRVSLLSTEESDFYRFCGETVNGELIRMQLHVKPDNEKKFVFTRDHIKQSISLELCKWVLDNTDIDEVPEDEKGVFRDMVKYLYTGL